MKRLLLRRPQRPRLLWKSERPRRLLGLLLRLLLLPIWVLHSFIEEVMALVAVPVVAAVVVRAEVEGRAEVEARAKLASFKEVLALVAVAVIRAEVEGRAKLARMVVTEVVRAARTEG
jgi:hypothetical protein